MNEQLKTPRNRRVPRVVSIVGWIIVGLLLALYIGLPTAMAVAAVFPTRGDVGAPPEGFGEVTLVTADGAELAAWYAEPENGSVIIVAHGAGGSRESMRRVAVMLAENGYGVLSLDLRGHGESQGRTNRLGWQGTQDIEAAVDYLQRQEDVSGIGAYGSSMGGEVVLGASGECAEITAIVADGATRRSTQELLALPEERSLVRSFTARVMYAAVRLFAWGEPPKPLLQEMRRSNSTEFMLIAAGENDLEVKFNELFARELQDRAVLWVAPGVTHTGAFATYPDEYEQRVLDFFGEKLRPVAQPEGTNE